MQNYAVLIKVTQKGRNVELYCGAVATYPACAVPQERFASLGRPPSFSVERRANFFIYSSAVEPIANVIKSARHR